MRPQSARQAIALRTELQDQYDFAVVARQLLQFQDGVQYRSEWDRKQKSTNVSVMGHVSICPS